MFQLSPGVIFSEINLTTTIPAPGTTQGAFAGTFVWGPIEDMRTVGSEVDLVSIYGPPTSNTFTDFFTCANFLTYGNSLTVVRTGGIGLLNSVANGAGVLIKHELQYNESYRGTGNTHGMWAGKWAGDLGNSLKVSMWSSPNTAGFAAWNFNGYFDSVPGTSSYANAHSGRNDELHIAIIDKDGRFTGTQNTVLEKFSHVSKAFDAKKDDGSSNYYVDVINNTSKYVWWLAHPDSGIGLANSTGWGATATGTAFSIGDNVAYTTALANGAYATSAVANTEVGYDFFKNSKQIDISLLMNSDHGATVGEYIIQTIAEYRKDCVAFVSPLRADVVNNRGLEATSVVATRNLFTSSSYAVMDSNWKYQFDKYNGVFRWVPLNGDIAGLCVRTDFERDAWFSPAGFNRGIIFNVAKLAWEPTQTEMDTLYKNGVNPVLTFNNIGPVLYGDKTMLAKPSAFDRINVRRLFIALEKGITKAAQYSLFEFNDSFTRSQFVALVEPFLRQVQGRKGIYDFRVVCDETNNTGFVIDQNQFVGDIYIKPSRSINFIQLNFVAVGTSVDFNEVVGQF